VGTPDPVLSPELIEPTSEHWREYALSRAHRDEALLSALGLPIPEWLRDLSDELSERLARSDPAR